MTVKELTTHIARNGQDNARVRVVILKPDGTFESALANTVSYRGDVQELTIQGGSALPADE